MFISNLGYEVPKHHQRKVRDELTVAPAPTPSNPAPLRFAAYVEYPDRFVVPFYWGLETFGPGRDVRAEPSPAPSLHFEGTLRSNQDEPVTKTLESIRTTGGAVLALPTGQGKTACALHIACALKLKTLVVVHKHFLADQWAARIAQFVPAARSSRIGGGVFDTSGDIVIALIQSLGSKRTCPFPSFGLLVFDECHHIGAPVFTKTLLNTVCAKHTLGLSATPTRKDGLERLISYFLGPAAWACTPTPTGCRSGIVDIVHYSCAAFNQPPPKNRRGGVDYVGLVTLLVNDAERSAVIAAAVPREADVLVLSHRRAHCETLAAMIGEDAAVYLGGAKTIPTARVLVSTFALVSEGFDEPRLTVLVLATPASDIVQAVGRIMRRPDAQPRVIDVVDRWGVCFAQAAKRRTQYRELGFTERSP